MVGLDKDVGKEVKMLMNMIKKNKKKRKSRKKSGEGKFLACERRWERRKLFGEAK